ncbi:MAG: ATP phosphoribosyltransferase regulatory subunit, partial [Lachnospiraceae bacterium]|nr:ATP phosphoribosyltransferase regulatory subunit [Lachnospiraceae bacterium]
FTSLPSLFGGGETLDRAEALTENPQALLAVKRLREIREILKLYGVEDYVSFDLGLLSRYMYYTGIQFRGYTFGMGAAILKGGRYDGLLRHFGKDAPAVGFVAEIDQLLLALSRQNIHPEVPGKRCMIIYESRKQAEAIEQASALRKKGVNVELVRITEQRSREDCKRYAQASSCEMTMEL